MELYQGLFVENAVSFSRNFDESVAMEAIPYWEMCIFTSI